MPSEIDSGFALAFDGNDYITGADFPILEDSNLTVAAWIRPSNIAADNTLFHVSGSNCAAYQTSIVGGRGSVEISNMSAGGGGTENSNNLIEDEGGPSVDGGGTTDDRVVTNNEWQNVAFAYNSGTVDIYVNGTKADTVAYNSPVGCEADTWTIGSSISTSFGNGFHGTIDSVQAFGEALGPGEISRLYKEGLPAHSTVIVGR